MGKMSEDTLDGSCCQLCNAYFEDSNGDPFTHEEPVVCRACFSNLSNEEKADYKVTDQDTMK